jgi:hypothetical protein
MPGAARTYAAKVFRRFLDRDIEPFELSPSHEGGGRFSYTLKSKKGGK